MSKLSLRAGPLDGLAVEPVCDAKVVVVAFQMVGGRRVPVVSPWSTAKGRLPVAGVEIEISTYRADGVFAHAGSDLAFEP